MARKPRLIEAGYYHIINRGVERRDIFLEPEDYDIFLDSLISIKKKYEITVHVYCLMTNHYHLLLQTFKSNISDAIKELNANYSIYFNKKYKRVGHLWQGRFLSYFLYDDAHFWIVAKYIERNPIKTNMVTSIEQYKYQSFFQWKHKFNYYKLVENSMIFDMTFKEYEAYISSDMDFNTLEKIYSTPKYINKNGTMKVLYERLETFFEKDRDMNRNKNIKKAFDYGYSKTEIARFLDISSTAISNILKKYKFENR